MVGRFARPEEIDRAVGPHLDLPDLAEYGQGKAGVFMIVKLVDGDYDRGRVLFLRDPPDCARIAAGRSWLAEWTPDGTPDQDWLWRVGTGPDPVGMEDYLGPPPAGGDDEQTAPDPGQSGPRRLHPVAGEVADLASARQARQARDARLVPAELAAAVDALRGPWAESYERRVPFAPEQALTLLLLIGRGSSNRDAARVILGNAGARGTVQKWAAALTRAGLVGAEGEGPGKRRVLTAEGEAFLARAGELVGAGPDDGGGDTE